MPAAQAGITHVLAMEGSQGRTSPPLWRRLLQPGGGIPRHADLSVLRAPPAGGFEFSYGIRGAVGLLRGLVGELEEAGEFGGVVFCCHAVGILLPGSFATYSANAAIAALTLPASGAFS
jgi:hypothetical protein